MENLTNKIEVLGNLLDVCQKLKSNAYSITFWDGQLKIQAHYSRIIVQVLSSEYGFEFNIDNGGFVNSKKPFYDFHVEITLT